MERARILIVEDEEDIAELVRFILVREGFLTNSVLTGEDALKFVRRDSPNLVLLDLMLPGMDGLEVCRQLKSDPKTKAVPVFMLTAKGEDADIVKGLETGADDYIVKPFSPKVLVARVSAALRRKGEPPPDDRNALPIRDLEIDPDRHRVTVKGKAVDLTHTEFLVLQLLTHKAGWVFTRNQIVDAVHDKDKDYKVTDRSVDVQIVGLRRKLGAVGTYVETVRGVGYRFKE